MSFLMLSPGLNLACSLRNLRKIPQLKRSFKGLYRDAPTTSKYQSKSAIKATRSCRQTPISSRNSWLNYQSCSLCSSTIQISSRKFTVSVDESLMPTHWSNHCLSIDVSRSRWRSPSTTIIGRWRLSQISTLSRSFKELKIDSKQST